MKNLGFLCFFDFHGINVKLSNTYLRGLQGKATNYLHVIDFIILLIARPLVKIKSN
jgi:hypothetical protein